MAAPDPEWLVRAVCRLRESFTHHCVSPAQSESGTGETGDHRRKCLQVFVAHDNI